MNFLLWKNPKYAAGAKISQPHTLRTLNTDAKCDSEEGDMLMVANLVFDRIHFIYFVSFFRFNHLSA